MPHDESRDKSYDESLMTSLQVTDDMLWKDAPDGLKSFRQEKRRRKRKKKENVQLKRSLSRLLMRQLKILHAGNLFCRDGLHIVALIRKK